MDLLLDSPFEYLKIISGEDYPFYKSVLPSTPDETISKPLNKEETKDLTRKVLN